LQVELCLQNPGRARVLIQPPSKNGDYEEVESIVKNMGSEVTLYGHFMLK